MDNGKNWIQDLRESQDRSAKTSSVKDWIILAFSTCDPPNKMIITTN